MKLWIKEIDGIFYNTNIDLLRLNHAFKELKRNGGQYT